MKRVLSGFLLAAGLIQAQTGVPVLIELFTSEGCSSCPPADDLLAQLEKTQPVRNVNLIVLSEHVDYWNSLGWRDPFSAKLFSERQQAYAQHSSEDSVYTPEAVIDGIHATVGSNRKQVLQAVVASAATPKADLDVSVRRDGNFLLVEFAPTQKGVAWIAVAQSQATSHVQHGENGGRTLQHVEVVRSLTKLKGSSARIQLDKEWGSDLNLVAFVQEESSGRILQAVQKKI